MAKVEATAAIMRTIAQTARSTMSGKNWCWLRRIKEAVPIESVLRRAIETRGDGGGNAVGPAARPARVPKEVPNLTKSDGGAEPDTTDGGAEPDTTDGGAEPAVGRRVRIRRW